MLKKLLILPILGSILGLGAFASANSVDNFTSDTEICKEASADGNYTYSCNSMINGDEDFYMCVSSSVVPYYFSSSIGGGIYQTMDNANYCFSNAYSWDDDVINLYTNDSDNQGVAGSFYFSLSPITYSSSSDSDSSLGIPEIPSSFTSGLTSLVNNFGGTIANWLPTIILVALGIYAIFALFRVVRNYARSSFRG